jgi:hypothetical protein
MSKRKVVTDSRISLKLPAFVGVLAIALTYYSYPSPRNPFACHGLYEPSDGSMMFQSSMPANQLPRAIFKRWVHSREEDTEEIMVFRPATFEFPRSRGRNGFEIKEDGVFVLYTIGATDGPRAIRGTWKLNDPDILVAAFDDDRIKSYSIKLISCSEDILKTDKRKFNSSLQ